MKIKIRNLGIISHIEINLRPLTIFIGPNNAGKTWAAYTLAPILGVYGKYAHTKAYCEEKIEHIFPLLDDIVQQVRNQGVSKLDLYQFANEFGEKYFNSVARLAQSWMGKWLSTTPELFNRLEVELSLDETKENFLSKILSSSINSSIGAGLEKENPLVKGVKKSGEKDIFYYTEGNVSEKLSFNIIKEFILRHIFELLHKAIYIDTIYFPTERTAYITLPFGVSTGSLDQEKIKSKEKESLDVFNTIHPVGKFLEMMDMISGLVKFTHLKAAKNFIDLSTIMEKEILSGSINFSTPISHSFRKVIFQPNTEVELEAKVASSMVKELSSMVLYLKYMAQAGHLVVIDEPEMNLHPQAQAKIIELLAVLVNNGVHVLLTTHSTYIVDHLVNLMKAAKYENKAEITEKFYLKNPEAFIPQEKVSAYLFENGTAKDILSEEGTIDWSNFGNISNHVSQIYFEI